MELLSPRFYLASSICIGAFFIAIECSAIPALGSLAGKLKSLDAYADDGKIHLLIATNRNGNKTASLSYTCSIDNGESWKPYQSVDTSSAPAYARGRGSDFQIAATGKKILVVWMQYGTGFMGRGPLSSAFSSDGGKSWRNTGNPADDDSDGDHAFIDLTTDDKGDFHAVWLDKRSGNDKGLYSAVYDSIAQSWKKNRTVDSKVCDCCWNVVKANSSGHLYALYRDKSPRDMGLAFSKDYGATWNLSGPVGNFQWNIEACVHVGGGLAIEEKDGRSQLHAVVWTGSPFNPGLYYLTQKNIEGTWREPIRLGGLECTLPDIAVAKSGQIAIAWIQQRSDGNRLLYLKSTGKVLDPLKSIRVQTGVVSPTHPKLLRVGDTLHLFWSGLKDNKEVWRHTKI